MVMEHVPTPNNAHRRDSAQTLLAVAEEHVEALAQVLATPELVPHPDDVLPMLRADLDLWTLVKALAEAQLTRWEMGDG